MERDLFDYSCIGIDDDEENRKMVMIEDDVRVDLFSFG